MSSLQDKFENIYEKSVWGKNWKGEGGSGKGDGTSPDSKMWIQFLTKFIKEHNIKTLADLGCGDWKFSRFIPWQELNVQYLGYDVVEKVVENNNQEYSSSHVEFQHGDITTTEVKGFNAVVIKDVLQHLSDEDVVKVLDKVLKDNDYVVIKNGYKFGNLTTRKNPQANDWTERNINNKYSYHPIALDKYPLNQYSNRVQDSKIHRYKQIVILKGDRVKKKSVV